MADSGSAPSGTRGATSGVSRFAAGARALLLALSLLGALDLFGVPGAARAQPTPAAPRVIDGPSTAIPTPTGLASAVARDGTGGIVYLKQVGGVAHVFLSPLVGGVFGTPVELDGGLPGPASQPVIAASNGGVLVAGFIDGTTLYVTQRTGAGAPISAPRRLAGGAANPSLEMSAFGKAYLAFTLLDGAGADVRVAYYHAGRWALESAPLNLTPADDAGRGGGRPAVAAAGDGVAIVAWGEAGHVYTRRVWATAPSVVVAQADAPLPGCTEIAADEPAVGSGGDSSYATVAFHEELSCGGLTESRVLDNRLEGSQFTGEVAVDALGTPPADGADRPAVAVAEYGTGWVTSEHTTSEDGYAVALGSDEVPAARIDQLNSLPGTTNPYVTPAMAGYYSSVIAWQRDPGTAGPAEIRMRYGARDGTLGPELVLSSPAQGPADAANGLAAAGNVSGEVLVAWAQMNPSGEEIVADQLYTSPGAPSATTHRYARTTRPRLTWAPSGELWGPVSYTVALDGASLGQTGANSLQLLAPLAQGPHAWQVAATNPAGLTSGTSTARFFVDTIPPRVTVLTLGGLRRAGKELHLHVVATDTPPGLPAADGSGIDRILVRWGDGTMDVVRNWRYHVYAKPGRYRVTVRVSDRAGNVTTVVLSIRVKPKPKRKSKSKSKSTGSPGTGSASVPGLPSGSGGHA